MWWILSACSVPAEPVPPRPAIPAIELPVDTRADEVVLWSAGAPASDPTLTVKVAPDREMRFRGQTLVFAARLVHDPAQCDTLQATLSAAADRKLDTVCGDQRVLWKDSFLLYSPQAAGCLITWSTDDEPLPAKPLGDVDGAYDAHLGSAPATIPGLVPAGDNVYTRPDDPTTFDGVELDDITYHFDNDRLWQIGLRVPAERVDALAAAVTARYGPSEDRWWSGCTASASFEPTDPGLFTIRSRAIFWERSERK